MPHYLLTFDENYMMAQYTQQLAEHLAHSEHLVKNFLNKYIGNMYSRDQTEDNIFISQVLLNTQNKQSTISGATKN